MKLFTFFVPFVRSSRRPEVTAIPNGIEPKVCPINPRDHNHESNKRVHANVKGLKILWLPSLQSGSLQRTNEAFRSGLWPAGPSHIVGPAETSDLPKKGHQGCRCWECSKLRL